MLAPLTKIADWNIHVAYKTQPEAESLVRLDDQLGQELIRQRVKVVSVELGLVACPQV